MVFCSSLCCSVSINCVGALRVPNIPKLFSAIHKHSEPAGTFTPMESASFTSSTLASTSSTVGRTTEIKNSTASSTISTTSNAVSIAMEPTRPASLSALSSMSTSQLQLQLAQFQGHVVHSAEWNLQPRTLSSSCSSSLHYQDSIDMTMNMHNKNNIDLSGKRVAVIGTGASAAQIIPTIAAQVLSLHVFPGAICSILAGYDISSSTCLWCDICFDGVCFFRRSFCLVRFRKDL